MTHKQMTQTPFSIGLAIPTHNAGSRFQECLDSILRQSLKPNRLLVIDSESSDGTAEIARAAGFEVEVIGVKSFNHGGTRNHAAKTLDQCDILIFVTQDAILASDDTLANLVSCFQSERVACAYGRQLPHLNARPIEAHARLYNYPLESRLKSKEDIPALGLKTAFCSNSFAAYRRTDFEAIGGFPHDVIFGEDMCIAARFILAGRKVAYCAEAPVHHSHNYSALADFRRYFDIGVLHAREGWLKTMFGHAEGEGLRFVKSEFVYLLQHAPWLLVSAFCRTFAKLVAYRLGQKESKLPVWLKLKLSMHPVYWLETGKKASEAVKN